MGARKKLDILVAAYGGLAALYLLGAVFWGSVGLLDWFGVVNPHNTLEKRTNGLIGGALFSVPLAVAGIVHAAMSVAVARRQPWARMAGLVLGLLDVLLCCNPLGCVVGAYSLFALLDDGAVEILRATHRDAA